MTIWGRELSFAQARRLLAALFLIWPVLLVDTSGDPMVDPVLVTTIRLVETRSFCISREDPKKVVLAITGEISVSGGCAYSGVAPGASLLAAPIYAALRPWLAAFDASVVKSARAERRAHYRRVFDLPPSRDLVHAYLLQIALVWLVMVPLFAAFQVRFFSFLVERGADLRRAFLVSAAVGLGSFALSYVTMYSRQGLAYLLIWHAVLSVVRGRPASTRSVVAAAALCAFAVAVDYSSIVLVAISLLFALPRSSSSQRVLGAVVLGLGAAALALYHDAIFGSPLSTPYHHRYWLPGKPLNGPSPSTFAAGGIAGVSLPVPGVALELAFGWYKGLFVYCPLLGLGAWGHVRQLLLGRDRWVHAYCLFVASAYLALNASMGAHLPASAARIVWGGLNILWGPRHLLGVVPFLAFGLLALPQGKRWLTTTLVTSLCLSAVLNVAGVLYRQDMMGMRADSPELEYPPIHVLKRLFQEGPYLVLLDAYGARRPLQWTILLLLVAFTVFVSWKVARAKSPRPVVNAPRASSPAA